MSTAVMGQGCRGAGGGEGLHGIPDTGAPRNKAYTPPAHLCCVFVFTLLTLKPANTLQHVLRLPSPLVSPGRQPEAVANEPRVNATEGLDANACTHEEERETHL